MMRAVKEEPIVTARTFGLEAVAAVKAGMRIRARDMALTAAHFGRIAIEATTTRAEERREG